MYRSAEIPLNEEQQDDACGDHQRFGSNYEEVERDGNEQKAKPKAK
jgi:hypothetical protein